MQQILALVCPPVVDFRLICSKYIKKATLLFLQKVWILNKTGGRPSGPLLEFRLSLVMDRSTSVLLITILWSVKYTIQYNTLAIWNGITIGNTNTCKEVTEGICFCGHLEGIYSSNTNSFETAVWVHSGRSYVMLCILCSVLTCVFLFRPPGTLVPGGLIVSWVQYSRNWQFWPKSFFFCRNDIVVPWHMNIQNIIS